MQRLERVANTIIFFIINNNYNSHTDWYNIMKSTLKVHNPHVIILLICITIYGITDGCLEGVTCTCRSGTFIHVNREKTPEPLLSRSS